ncbi:uncharacterized protein LOC132743462 [Ruditapes philippinarum]|uniref:uncharacterized protein LOC132743462 n=1 Tax=Ruditapes philippinarum TaxID=129788 RepID=UPI00295B9E68|nr:uncharacterized protein LOC132743462 [Ruditapes philippinarum]
MEDEKKVRRHFCYLKDNLEIACGLLDYFIQEGIFTEDQVELINSEQTRRRKVDCMLRILLKSESEAFSWFLNFLTKTDNDHIRRELESEVDKNTLEISDSENSSTTEMWKVLNILKNNKREITKELEPEIVLNYLFQYNQFSLDEYEEVVSKKTRGQTAKKLMKILATIRHMPRGYAIFLKALKDDGQKYLYKLLSEYVENQTNVQPSTSEAVNLTNVNLICLFAETQDSVLREDADSSEIRILFDPKKKRKIYKEIIKTFNLHDRRQCINDILVPETACLLDEATEGSLILKIRGCHRGAISAVFGDSLDSLRAGISRVLGIVFSQIGLDKNVENMKVQVVAVNFDKTLKNENDQKDENYRRSIADNLEYLKEEIDAKSLLHLTIFSEHEKEAILELRSMSRSKGTQLMLEIALKKSEENIRLFLEELKERKNYVWENIFKADSETDSRKMLISNYSILVENLCPSLIARYCKQNDLIDFEKFQHFVSNGKPRTWIAKFILHEILRQSDTKVNTFLNLLATFQPSLHSTIVSGTADDDLSEDQGVYSDSDDLNDDNCSNLSGDFRITFDGENVGGMQECVLKTAQTSVKEILQADDKEKDCESGYKSMSLKKRKEMLDRLSADELYRNQQEQQDDKHNANNGSSSKYKQTTKLGLTSTSSGQAVMPESGN